MADKKFSINASSQVKPDTLANFLAAQLEEDLETVPGIGPANKRILEEAGIPTTHALIGVFLTLRGKGMTVEEHVQAFYIFLHDKGIKAYRAGICRAIAEKTNSFIPGCFDETAFAE